MSDQAWCCSSVTCSIQSAALLSSLFPESSRCWSTWACNRGALDKLHGVEPAATRPGRPTAAWSNVQASRPGSRPRLALFASLYACDSSRRYDDSRRCLYNPPKGVSARRLTGEGVYGAEHDERDQRTTGASHAGRPGGTRPPDRAGAAAGRDGRTAAGSARPPLFEAERYRVDDHNVLLKEQRQVDQSCSFLA
jgi:hypothetical protein